MLSDDREFYDLCRKYKYYYNAYQKIKPLEDVYWSKYLKEAHDEVVSELKDIEEEIIFRVLYELLGDTPRIDIERIVDDRVVSSPFCFTKPRRIGEKVTVVGNDSYNERIKRYYHKLLESKNL